MKFRMRTARGVPSGGEFATERRAEPDITLEPTTRVVVHDVESAGAQRLADILEYTPGARTALVTRSEDRGEDFTATVQVNGVRAVIERTGDTYSVTEQYYQGHPTEGVFTAESDSMSETLGGQLRAARRASLAIYSMNAVEAQMRETGHKGPFPVFMSEENGTTVGFWAGTSRDQVRITAGEELTARAVRADGSERRMRLSKALKISGADEESLRTYLDLVGAEYARRAGADDLLASA